MEDDKKQNEQVDLGDWDPDRFPTSAKPVFKKSILLVFFLGALCFLLYQCSEHEESPESATKSSGSPPDIEEVNPFGDQDEEPEMSL